MAKETKKSSSVAPLIIIGVVLALAIGGFAMLYSTSKSPAANNAAASGRTNAGNIARNQQAGGTIPQNAPPGAAIGINALGLPTAKVTIEEFADFQCPSCRVAHPVMKELQGEFAGNNNVRFVFRHFPLPIHDKSYDASVAVEAAGAQGGPKFWAMMDQMMNNQQEWSSNPNYKNLWRGYAEKIGLNIEQWENDAAGLGVKSRVNQDLERARGVGVGSTPSVYINGRLVPFSDVNVTTMKQLIDAEIENVTKASAPASSGSSAANANANR